MLYRLLEIALLCSILGVVVAIFMRGNSESFSQGTHPLSNRHRLPENYYSGGSSSGTTIGTSAGGTIGGVLDTVNDYGYFGDPVGNLVGMIP